MTNFLIKKSVSSTYHFSGLVTNHFVLIEAQNNKFDKKGCSTSELDKGIVDMILPVESIRLL